MNHDLKIDIVYLQQKLAGHKLFEIRCNNRGYQKGDTVTYTGYATQERTGLPNKYVFEITYVTNFNQKDDWVVFGEKPLI